MNRSTLTTKGQTTIPAEVRERLALKPGDAIIYIEGPDGSVTIRRALSVDELAGSLKRYARSPTLGIKAERAAVREAIARKWRERGV